MTREYSDDLLSGYLDGELSRTERRLVEDRLAAGASEQQLFAEFQHLRSELTALPRAQVSAGFTERVVQAAVERKAALASRRGRMWQAAGALAMATAACGLWMVLSPQFDRPAPVATLMATQSSLSPLDSLLAGLRAALPANNETLVLRLRVPNQPSAAEFLNAALKKAGLVEQSAADAAQNAAALSAAHRAALEKRLQLAAADAAAWEAATTASADAFFIQASLAELESMLAALYSEPSPAVMLLTEARLALFDAEAVGGVAAPLASAQAIVQHLDAALFRLEKRSSYDPYEPAVAVAQEAPGGGGANGKGPIRVLLLVERFDAP